MKMKSPRKTPATKGIGEDDMEKRMAELEEVRKKLTWKLEEVHLEKKKLNSVERKIRGRLKVIEALITIENYEKKVETEDKGK